jgi:hypothetical protein
VQLLPLPFGDSGADHADLHLIGYTSIDPLFALIFSIGIPVLTLLLSKTFTVISQLLP